MEVSYSSSLSFAINLLKRSLLMTSDFTQLGDNSYDADEWGAWRNQIRELVLNYEDGWLEFPDPPNDSLGMYIRESLFDAHLLGQKVEHMELSYEELKLLGMTNDAANDAANGITH
jgi:hypothetical protein